MTKNAWGKKFDNPIMPPNGKPLVTLRDAANYIIALPKKESAVPEWQAAMQALILVAECDGQAMLASIGVMLALHRNDPPRPLNAVQKETRWAKRRLKRDG